MVVVAAAAAVLVAVVLVLVPVLGRNVQLGWSGARSGVLLLLSLASSSNSQCWISCSNVNRYTRRVVTSRMTHWMTTLAKYCSPLTCGRSLRREQVQMRLMSASASLMQVDEGMGTIAALAVWMQLVDISMSSLNMGWMGDDMVG